MFNKLNLDSVGLSIVTYAMLSIIINHSAYLFAWGGGSPGISIRTTIIVIDKTPLIQLIRVGVPSSYPPPLHH